MLNLNHRNITFLFLNYSQIDRHQIAFLIWHLMFNGSRICYTCQHLVRIVSDHSLAYRCILLCCSYFKCVILTLDGAYFSIAWIGCTPIWGGRMKRIFPSSLFSCHLRYNIQKELKLPICFIRRCFYLSS